MKHVFMKLSLIMIAVITCHADIAQTQNSLTETGVIVCSGDSEAVLDAITDSTSAGAWAPENLSGYCYTDLIRTIENNLKVYGISLSIIQDSSEAGTHPSAAIEMYTTMSVNGAPVVELIPGAKPEPLQQTSVLEAHPGSRLYLYIVSAEEKIATSHLVTGIILYTMGYCDLALPYFDKAESSSFHWHTYTERGNDFRPEGFARFYKGNCAILQQDYETAIHYFETVFSDHEEIPSLPAIELQTNLAWSYLQLGNEEKAFEIMDRVTNATENMAVEAFRIRALTKRAQLHALAFNYDAAITDMDYAIQLNPDNAVLYTLRGQIILNLYEWDRALEDFNTSFALDPTYPLNYFQRGLLYYSILQTGLETREDALLDFQNYLEFAPDGEYAAQASQYIESIKAELEALRN